MTRTVQRFFIAWGLFALVGCARHEAPPPAASAATEVVVAQPALQTLHYTIEQPGRIEPFEQTPIYAKIAGYVGSVRVEIGDRVKRGDVLAELDVPELIQEHQRKKALLEQIRLGVRQAKQAEQVAEASQRSAAVGVEVAQASRGRAAAAFERWELEYKRMEGLVKQGVVDRQNRDEVQRQYRAAAAAKAETEARIRAAEAALAEAQARRVKAGIDREAAHAAVAVAEADERHTRALVGYTKIVAPYDGVVSDRRAHTGHFLQAATGGNKGEPLFVVVRLDKVRVFLEVPEADAVHVCSDCPGRIRVQVLNDREFIGKVAGTSWSLDPQQRTLRTEIDFDNANGLLRPGMYIHAHVDVNRPNAWVVPAAAVLVRDGVTFCYEVRDDKTHRRPVRLGLRAGKGVEILKFQSPPRRPGERPGWVDPTGKEMIVASRPGELSDNQAVQIKSGR